MRLKVRDPKVWIRAFVIFHISAILICNFPGISPVRRRVSSLFRWYVDFLSLDQNWSMFAPEPSSINPFIRAEIRFANGEIRFYDPPRMANLGVWERYAMERYRKWSNDYVRLDDYKHVWPVTARYFARKANKDPSNPPVEVKLWRYWMILEDPRVKFRPVDFKMEDSELQRYLFFKTDIRFGDLR